MVIYSKCDNPMISCAILEVPIKGFVSTVASIASAREETRHVIWKPVKNGSYAKVTPEQKKLCKRGQQ